MIGKLLGGRYRLERLLGEGGMGAVYEATNVAIGKRVAVKTVHPDKVVRPETIERFRRESFAMAAVESEHVAAILDAGDDPESGVAFFVMELLAGEDLSRLLQRVRALSPQAALRVAAQALEGLRAAQPVPRAAS
jgi:eukaryotic-like serine/threonine-protein kinase